MLTDIFAERYSSVEIWRTYSERERRLLAQSFRILSEQICPYYVNGQETERSKAFWKDIHDRLSMELGLKSLSPLTFSYQTNWNGVANTAVHLWTFDKVCENWMSMNFDESLSADRFIKDRMSLIEIAFRKQEKEIALENAEMPEKIFAAKLNRRGEIHLPGDPADGIRALNRKINERFIDAVNELNTRFQQAGCQLNYHNGFIQLTTDLLTATQIEKPFWALVADPIWKNVDADMKEALDQRDTGARDPAFYAIRALESTIKIISDLKGWTHGQEKGAQNFIDNLTKKEAAFIHPWEAEILKQLFTKVRNLLGHGPGSEAMLQLSRTQTDWAIESCMAWIKSLVQRTK